MDGSRLSFKGSITCSQWTAKGQASRGKGTRPCGKTNLSRVRDDPVIGRVKPNEERPESYNLPGKLSILLERVVGPLADYS